MTSFCEQNDGTEAVFYLVLYQPIQGGPWRSVTRGHSVTPALYAKRGQAECMAKRVKGYVTKVKLVEVIQ